MDYSDKTDAPRVGSGTSPVEHFGKNHHDIATEDMRRDVAQRGLCRETRELRLPPPRCSFGS